VWGLIASGWLFGLLPALALARERVRSRTQRRALNRSLHELRRPLQAVALGADAGSGAPLGFLDLALSALGDLDRALNGADEPREHRELVSGRRIAVAAAGRWRGGRSAVELKLFWDAGEAMLLADAGRVGQALDNLIANALEHGGPPLWLTASVVGDRVRMTISDGGAGAGASGRSPNGARNRLRPAPEPRRGHGLAVVSQIAEAHGGRFALSSSRLGSVAALELPLARAELLAA
jgi:signal transduction histidine kinase